MLEGASGALCFIEPNQGKGLRIYFMNFSDTVKLFLFAPRLISRKEPFNNKKKAQYTE